MASVFDSSPLAGTIYMEILNGRHRGLTALPTQGFCTAKNTKAPSDCNTEHHTYYVLSNNLFSVRSRYDDDNDITMYPMKSSLFR
jgi:hypothetical protein